jgi:pimeloyl-ACP methyl ester carboxylesterase
MPDERRSPGLIVQHCDVTTAEAPTFVLVPGMSATAYTWTPVVRELALLGHRALPVELPGHGFDTTFPPGYQGQYDEDTFVQARSPIAGLTLDDYVEHTLGLVRRAATNGPVILVGHSLGGATVTRVANATPGLLARTVYLCAYCCVALPTVMAYATYAADPNDPNDPLARARERGWVGNPASAGATRTNPRTGDPKVLAAQHALLMADLDPARAPAVLSYGLQPDEPVAALTGNAQVDPATWTSVPHSYIRTLQDRVIPPDLQDRMIAEADAISPDNPFDVHSLDTSHLALITQPTQIAETLYQEPYSKLFRNQG